MSARVTDLLNEGEDRWQLIEYDDGRLFISTKLGAIPITELALAHLGGAMGAASIAIAFRQGLVKLAKDIKAADGAN